MAIIPTRTSPSSTALTNRGDQRPQARTAYGGDEPSVPPKQRRRAPSSRRTITSFVAISPVFPACYQQTPRHSTIAGSLPEPLTGRTGRTSRSSPIGELRPASARGLQEGRRLQGQEGGDLLRRRLGRSEVKVCNGAQEPGVPVALTAEDSVQATDAVASDQETQSIAQRFQSAGVNVVIGVGGSARRRGPAQ